ncbi:MAG: transcription termination/antitermination protein NusA [Firmicutes bacterium]|nr:transcription termination/antitermination protein NusA [Bacillota bacterium]
MNLELIGALNDLEKERGISKDIIIDAIETAIVSAYKRNFGLSSSSGVRVNLDEKTGEIHVFSRKLVVEKVNDESTEISLADAHKLDPNYQIGDITELEVTPRDFGRIAAQTAKQVVIQRIREAERSMIFDQYVDREGDVINGIINRIDNNNVIIHLGKVEAVLPLGEQIPMEKYVPNDRMRFYINEVKQTNRGPQIFLSRTHPGLLKYLFEIEVPEIQSGTVEIKSVSREAGNRSKIAVFSRDENVDPIGACVGNRGMRVQAVVSQLNGEKIDIIQWLPDEANFIANALSPAKVTYVKLDDESKTAHTVVPDDQLSLAIGKEGQNARLAARLTGWKIDIKSESQALVDPLFQIKKEADEEEIDAEEKIEESSIESAETIEKTENSDEIDQVDEEPESDKETQIEDMEALIAKLNGVPKRKSWEERFGSVTQTVGETTVEEKPEPEKPKRKKKKEKIIKDFSMLDLDDFKFDKED